MTDKKKRVLYLTNIPSPYRVDFFNELGKSCNLTVLFERDKSTEREHSWHKYSFQNFKAIFLKGIKLKKHSFSLEVLKFLKKDWYDIIVIGGYSTPTGMLAIKFLNYKKIPFVLNTDGGVIKDDTKLKFQIKKYFIKSASVWLSTGLKTNEYLLHYGAEKDGIFVYPFTSMSEKDLADKPRSIAEKQKSKVNLNINPEKKMVLSIGQFIYRKGYDVLLSTIAKLPSHYQFYIIGGAPIEEYNKKIEELKIDNVTFLDFMSKNELRDYFNASDLFVLPTREDIWGLVINEAMANGLPVITTDKCIAGSELVKDDLNGFIIPSENVDELGLKINKCLEDEKRLERMSYNSLKTISNYTIENMASVHMRIFDRIGIISDEERGKLDG